MSVVRTILGDIDPKLMGVTDAHEHLIRIGGGEVAHGGEDMRLPSVENAVEETRLFLAAGGKTIVDTAPCSLGRDIRKLLEVNAQVDAHIVASTGFQEGMLYDNVVHWVARYTVEQIAGLLVADIEEGIDIHDYMGPIVERSTARAGAIKVGTGYGMISPFEAKIIHAAALAQRATGAVAQHAHPRRHDGVGAGPTADALRRPARAHHTRPRAAQPGSLVPQEDRGPGRQLHV